MDSPLTESGREEAKSWRAEASLLCPELVVVSPLQRAVQTAQLTFADHRDVCWVAHEGCREELGLLICNKLRPLSECKADFPSINFDQVAAGDEDLLFNPERRETPLNMSERIYEFMTGFIRSRPEQEIAIIGHSAWLFNLFNAVMDCGNDDDARRWFLTSELRSMSVSFLDPE